MRQLTFIGLGKLEWREEQEPRLEPSLGYDPREEYTAMLSGSCLCESVAYEVDAPIGPIAHCHCRTCRKAHGSAFSSVSSVPRDKFRWTRGEGLLASFESSPGKLRRFCSRCGSHILAERIGQQTVILRLGCLDTPVTAKPKAHIWRSEGASWFDPKDQLPELHGGVPSPAGGTHG